MTVLAGGAKVCAAAGDDDPADFRAAYYASFAFAAVDPMQILEAAAFAVGVYIVGN